MRVEPHNRCARKLTATSRTSERTYQRKRVRLQRGGDVCWQCHLPVDPELIWPHPLSWTADHVEAVSRGGHIRGLILPAH
jgi:hypothetical protein